LEDISIGLYYLIREAVIIPGPLFGDMLWGISPQVMFLTVFTIGAFGVFIFIITIIEE